MPAPQGVREAEIGSPGLVFTVTPQPLTTLSCLWRIYFGDKHCSHCRPVLRGWPAPPLLSQRSRGQGNQTRRQARRVPQSGRPPQSGPGPGPGIRLGLPERLSEVVSPAGSRGGGEGEGAAPSHPLPALKVSLSFSSKSCLSLSPGS